MPRPSVTEHNKHAWDREVAGGTNPWTLGVSPEAVARARAGDLWIYLTPTKTVPAAWWPSLDGARVLCLASGGGQQGPLLAAAGASVTVFDNSPRQLAVDREVAAREGIRLETIEGDAADLSMLADASFDMVVHPVANCFMESLPAVWREAARVLRPGGRLLAGFTNPVVYLFDEEAMTRHELRVTHPLPYSPWNADAEAETASRMMGGAALEFGHTLRDQLAGQTDAGLCIVDLYEDGNKPEADSPLDRYTALFLATLAVKWDWRIACSASDSDRAR